MRDKKHYQRMMIDNPSASIGATLAADIVYAHRVGIVENTTHSTAEWKSIARNLKSKYGETLSLDDVLSESMTLNELLVFTRNNRDLTQIEAAAQIGVSLPTLRTWEQGMPITAKKIPIIEKFINGV